MDISMAISFYGLSFVFYAILSCEHSLRFAELLCIKDSGDRRCFKRQLERTKKRTSSIGPRGTSRDATPRACKGYT